MSASVEICEENGGYTAIDTETGERGRGETRAVALAALVISLHAAEEGTEGDQEPKAAVGHLSAQIQDWSRRTG